ncbi:hypothetical protein CH333_03785 [candidate division WOR-3 bacterium JGI_Cruoil_03_44_89]|uniref:DUF3996 domain-containing protein n=1 Tax=candidate division WOR-3 bacterium JGI_Cruoil_03_44_89 TaxID=1973748 RepID=A0A235BXM0_UNCW3|nr:MAG: hypothetical protein CH333_03785 [candidate division WOR-3 bacterium JGI_Cruoil_03_44_89]
MFRPIVVFVLTAVLLCSTVAAQDSGFGLGIIVGEPTGLSAKLWTANSTAINGAVGWSFAKESALYLHADYLLHNFNLFKVEKGKLPLYYGIGVRIKFEDNSKVGIRIPVGINYIFVKAPLDILLEIAPLLDLAPSTEFGLNGAIGIRYFFQ